VRSVVQHITVCQSAAAKRMKMTEFPGKIKSK